MSGRLIRWLALAFLAVCIALGAFEHHRDLTMVAYMRQCVGLGLHSQAKCAAMLSGRRELGSKPMSGVRLVVECIGWLSIACGIYLAITLNLPANPKSRDHALREALKP
jgi:hypothetical protein